MSNDSSMSYGSSSPVEGKKFYKSLLSKEEEAATAMERAKAQRNRYRSRHGHQDGGPLSYVLVQPEHIDGHIISFLETPDRKSLRHCNKHLRDRVDELWVKLNIDCYERQHVVQALLDRPLKLQSLRLILSYNVNKQERKKWPLSTEERARCADTVFAMHERLTHLTHLDLTVACHGISPALAALAGNEQALPKLESLVRSIWYPHHPGHCNLGIRVALDPLPTFTQQLLNASFYSRIEHLGVEFDYWDDKLKTLLLSCGNLESLYLRCVHHQYSEYEDSASVFFDKDNACFKQLKRLEMFNIGSESVIFSLSKAELPALTCLTLSSCEVPGEDIDWRETKWKFSQLRKFASDMALTSVQLGQVLDFDPQRLETLSLEVYDLPSELVERFVSMAAKFPNVSSLGLGRRRKV